MDLDHLLGNMSSLVVSGCYLESHMSTQRFAATVLSLTALSQALTGASTEDSTCLQDTWELQSRQFKSIVAVGLSWLECKWLGAWQSYFLGNAIGFSGVCFALQVRLGTVSADCQTPNFRTAV